MNFNNPSSALFNAIDPVLSDYVAADAANYFYLYTPENSAVKRMVNRIIVALQGATVAQYTRRCK